MELIWDLDSYECHLENGNGQGYSKAYHSKKKTLNLGECVWHVIVRVCLHDTVFKWKWKTDNGFQSARFWKLCLCRLYV